MTSAGVSPQAPRLPVPAAGPGAQPVENGPGKAWGLSCGLEVPGAQLLTSCFLMPVWGSVWCQVWLWSPGLPPGRWQQGGGLWGQWSTGPQKRKKSGLQGPGRVWNQVATGGLWSDPGGTGGGVVDRSCDHVFPKAAPLSGCCPMSRRHRPPVVTRGKDTLLGKPLRLETGRLEGPSGPGHGYGLPNALSQRPPECSAVATVTETPSIALEFCREPRLEGLRMSVLLPPCRPAWDCA